MSEFDDDFDDEGARDGLTRQLRTKGAIIAYDTAVAICLDPKATAAAKASAVNSLFRAGGFFTNSDNDSAGKEPHEMTRDELDAAIRKAKLIRGDQQKMIEKPGGGLFD